jgi:hypothetical protein
MLYTVSHRTLTAEFRFRSHADPCEFCGGRSGTGTGISPSTVDVPMSVAFHDSSVLISLFVTDV